LLSCHVFRYNHTLKGLSQETREAVEANVEKKRIEASQNGKTVSDTRLFYTVIGTIGGHLGGE